MASCADCTMSFDDHDAVVRSEERTLSAGEVKVLQVRSQEKLAAWRFRVG